MPLFAPAGLVILMHIVMSGEMYDSHALIFKIENVKGIN